MATTKKAKQAEKKSENIRSGLGVDTLKRAFADNLVYTQCRFPQFATLHDYYMALAYTVRDRMVRRIMKGVETYLKKDLRIVCYLSAEFLLGPRLGNNLINLGIYDEVDKAVKKELGFDLRELLNQEEEPGLGNGELGRQGIHPTYMIAKAILEKIFNQ